MDHKTCEFCGTEYDSSLPQCPLCGRVNAAQKPAQPEKAKRRVTSSTGGARVAPKEHKGVNGWKIASIILGILVIAGIAGFFIVMDFGDERFDPNGIPTLMDGQQPALPGVPSDGEEQLQKPEEVPAAPADPGACTGLVLSSDAMVMETFGQQELLVVTTTPMDCTEEISFESSDEAVVTVTGSGVVTAVGYGEAKILVTCGEITEICKVKCIFEKPEEKPETLPEEKPEEKPENVDPDQKPAFAAENMKDFTFKNPEESTRLTIVNVPEGTKITYASSDPSVAMVDEEGKVTAVSSGTATITVTVGDVTLEAIARCDLPEGTSDGKYTAPFKLSHTDVTLFKAGESFTLSLLDANGEKVEEATIFATNNCVTITGTSVKAAASGQCTVTMVYQDVAYSCIVRCNF